MKMNIPLLLPFSTQLCADSAKACLYGRISHVAPVVRLFFCDFNLATDHTVILEAGRQHGQVGESRPERDPGWREKFPNVLQVIKETDSNEPCFPETRQCALCCKVL